jgi:hypothetical protein
MIQPSYYFNGVQAQTPNTTKLTAPDPAQQAIRHARRLIQEFSLSDTTLWPILSEIDLVLSKGIQA